MRASASQIAGTNRAVLIASDTVSTSTAYPLFSKVPSGTAETIWTSDPYYTYVPSDGRLSSQRLEATQGIVFNSSAISLDYTFPAGDNGTSCGPVTVTSAITVPTGSEWMIL